MRVLLQRVKRASVSVEGNLISSIGYGLLLLVGFESIETEEEMDWMARKLINLRIFDDENGVMNLSLQDAGADLMIISQFTLFARTKKGNRPSYSQAAPASVSVPYYEKFIAIMRDLSGKEVKTGLFGAEMMVDLVNHGPVTIFMDSKNKDLY